MYTTTLNMAEVLFGSPVHVTRPYSPFLAFGLSELLGVELRTLSLCAQHTQGGIGNLGRSCRLLGNDGFVEW